MPGRTVLPLPNLPAPPESGGGGIPAKGNPPCGPAT